MCRSGTWTFDTTAERVVACGATAESLRPWRSHRIANMDYTSNLSLSPIFLGGQFSLVSGSFPVQSHRPSAEAAHHSLVTSPTARGWILLARSVPDQNSYHAPHLRPYWPVVALGRLRLCDIYLEARKASTRMPRVRPKASLPCALTRIHLSPSPPLTSIPQTTSQCL